MTDTQDLIREIQEHTAAHGGENTATHLLVQAAMALRRQADELEAIGAGGVSGPLVKALMQPTWRRPAPRGSGTGLHLSQQMRGVSQWRE